MGRKVKSNLPVSIRNNLPGRESIHHRENSPSPVTQTSPKPTLLSWGGGPREQISLNHDYNMTFSISPREC